MDEQQRLVTRAVLMCVSSTMHRRIVGATFIVLLAGCEQATVDLPAGANDCDF